MGVSSPTGLPASIEMVTGKGARASAAKELPASSRLIIIETSWEKRIMNNECGRRLFADAGRRQSSRRLGRSLIYSLTRGPGNARRSKLIAAKVRARTNGWRRRFLFRSEEHTSEL